MNGPQIVVRTYRSMPERDRRRTSAENVSDVLATLIRHPELLEALQELAENLAAKEQHA